MIKKALFALLLAGIFLFSVPPVFAGQATVYFFWSATCPHCAKEKVFLEKLDRKYEDITVKKYEISTSRTNAELFEAVGALLNADVSGVPFTVVGSTYVRGYFDDDTTGRAIEEAALAAVTSGGPDVVAGLLDTDTDSTPAPAPARATSGSAVLPETIRIPVVGNVRLQDLSLPVLTVVVALLDGFNPCAMWTLLFLISLLLGMKDRMRMWILGSAFIFTSGLIYFVFLSAWLNVFLFLGFVSRVRIIIGFVAVAAGVYYLRDYITNKEGACAVIGTTKRQRVFERLREVALLPNMLIALSGIILLAIAVNMVELVCSAGLPAIYTSILSLAKLPAWQYYLYLAAYIIIFMLDDLFVFAAAMLTLKAVGLESKYARASHLIGGILMFILGLLLLFRPELLMFG